MRRLAITLMVVAVMVATMVGGALTASAQVPGQTVACAPWQQAWYVSYSEWWYFWTWRWCYNPSIQGGWYLDWVNWYWGSYEQGPGNFLAGPGLAPGYQYTVDSIQQ